MDFITVLADRLKMEPTALAELMHETAEATVIAAAQGQKLTDTMTKTQLGTVLVALQWNHNPAIRKAATLKRVSPTPATQTGVRNGPTPTGTKRRRGLFGG